MKIEYVPKNFAPASLAVIAQAEVICTEYQAQGYDLTLRQLYYQFVARGLILNKATEYKRIGSIINDARLAGMLDWDFIVDRTRNIRSLGHWDAPSDIIDSAADSFRVDKWAKQPTRIEVWIEKDALSGVLEAVCPDLDVPYFACRGNVSQSEQWSAAQRLNKYLWAGQDVLILHLGDHDPSGIDMSRDNEDRLRLFMHKDLITKMKEVLRKEVKAGRIDPDAEDYKTKAVAFLDEYEKTVGKFEFRRIALNMDQVEEYNPPPNFAKTTDSRFAAYEELYGDQSWELDALPPDVLATLVTDNVEEARDSDLWEEAVAEEERGKTLLRLAAGRWAEVTEMLEDEEEPS
jgi:hypothetical protein